MKICIIGSRGELGRELFEIINKKNIDIQGFARPEVDITNLDSLNSLLRKTKFDIVINCAAYTDVDDCESNVDLAFNVNVLGAGNVAKICGELDLKLVHFSTDFVFSGDTVNPYQEWDLCNPINVYGKSKYLSEQYVMQYCKKSYVIRTAWLYSKYGKNFVKTILDISKNREEIKVVDDQFGNPTNAADLARHILKIVNTNQFGIYHCTGNGICSKYEFAREIIKLSDRKCKVIPCKTGDFNEQAKRPLFSALDNLKLRNTVGDEMRDWKEAICEFMTNETLK